MPSSAGNQATLRPIETIILAMPGTLPTTVAGPMDVFTQAGQLWEQLCAANSTPRFKVRIVSIDGKEVTCMNGMQIKPQGALADVNEADLLIVTSANVSDRHAWRKTVVPHLTRLHAQGTRIASICTGAFDWGFVPMFRELYPEVDVRPERMLTQDGSIFCSGGINAYAELCLYLVEYWCGYKTAEQLARALVLDGWREQQMDYSLFEFQKRHGDSAILKAQNHMETHFRDTLNVADLAKISAMSERNFKRRFKKATGDTPNEYLQRLRIEHAKHRLERSMQSIEGIADEVGYRDVAYFRQLFKQLAGMTPQAYRTKMRVSLSSGSVADKAVA